MKTKITGIHLLLSLIIPLHVFSQSNEIDATNKNNTTIYPDKKQLKISGYAEINYYRHYLWRGSLWGSNDVSQPEVHLDYSNFSVAFCSNINLLPKNLSLENYKKKVAFDEQDVELGYHNSIGKLEYQVLLDGYFYFNQLNTTNTGEFCVNIQYPVWKNISFFIENAVDIASYKGAFYTATGLIYEKEIKNLGIEFKLFSGSANSKFNNTYFDASGTNLNFIGTSFNLEYCFTRNFYVAVNGEYNQYINKEIKTITGLKKTDNFSIFLGFEF